MKFNRLESDDSGKNAGSDMDQEQEGSRQFEPWYSTWWFWSSSFLAIILISVLSWYYLTSNWITTYGHVVRPRIPLIAPESGRVRMIRSKAGEHVSNSAVLIDLSNQVLTSRLNKINHKMSNLKAEMKQAQRTRSRYEKLRVTGSVSQTEYERIVNRARTAKSQYQQAKATYREVRSRVRRLGVRAADSGTVEKITVNHGEWVEKGQTVGTVLTHGTPWIRSYVYGVDLKNIEVGQSVTLTPLRSSRGFNGEIVQIQNNGSQRTNELVGPARIQSPVQIDRFVVEVRIKPKSLPGFVRAGTPVQVQIPR